MSQGLVDGGVQVDALCLAIPYLCRQLGVGEGRLGRVIENRSGVVLDGAVEACARCGGRVWPVGDAGVTARAKQCLAPQQVAGQCAR